MILLILALLLVPSIALAAPAANVDTLPGWLDAATKAVEASNWKAVGALALLGVVIAVRALADRQGWTSISSGMGAVITSAVLGIALSLTTGALAGTLAGFGAISKAILDGILLAMSSSGGYSWWKTHKESKQDV
jgi:hypothetical protein